MEKRGQLTIFIIIGIVILVILGIVFFVMYSPSGVRVPPEEFSDVQKYVDACVDQTLRDGVVYLGRGPNPNYNEALANYIKDYLVYCANFTADFPELEVTPKDLASVTVSLNAEKSLVTAVVNYPITVRKGDMTKTLERFYAEYQLVEKYCASISVDSDCKSTSNDPVTVKVAGLTFTYNKGDFVGIDNKCIACK